ncbi:hypothetical protein EVAR_4315_1 [Eumeta japonica]|uniref:Uncharacterized protein n=1 Tax=Eumeta variegata TaxID=151549 RepID=A0A4C1VBC7_EUMVA|nr:hypothetical protein EVAR_4315_1 [Eumeta japonica]
MGLQSKLRITQIGIKSGGEIRTGNRIAIRIVFEGVIDIQDERIRSMSTRAKPGARVRERTKLRRSELPTNVAMRVFNAPQTFLLLPRASILRHCNAFVTNFTAAEFHACYITCAYET